MTSVIIGAVLLATGLYIAAAEHLWLRNAEITDGTIIELIHGTGKSRKAVKPRVAFEAPDGSRHEFTRSYSSSPHGFTQGQRVLVAYNPQTFEGRILTFGQRFGFAAVFSCAGIALLLLGATFAIGRDLVPRIYLTHGATFSEDTRVM